MTRREWLLQAALIPLLAACGQRDVGPIEPHWDRDVCERCRMVLSDRRHGAEIRHRLAGGRSKVYEFDDIGCALIWLDQQPWKADPEIGIWVNDWRTGEWIDARKAWYVPGQVTPMGYGLGAQKDPAPGALDFAQARKHIYEVERRFNAPPEKAAPPASEATP